MRKKRKLIPIREKQIHFRVTQEMFDLICTDAQKAGMSISVYCRNAVLNRKIVQHPLVLHDDTALARELHHLLGEMDKMVIRCNRELEREYGN